MKQRSCGAPAQVHSQSTCRMLSNGLPPLSPGCCTQACRRQKEAEQLLHTSEAEAAATAASVTVSSLEKRLAGRRHKAAQRKLR